MQTKMSTGYPKIRRRFTKAYYIYDLTYELTQEQFYEFETFFKFDLGYGVLEFDLPDLLSELYRHHHHQEYRFLYHIEFLHF